LKHRVFMMIAALLLAIHQDQSGAIKVKPLADVAKKWGEVTPQRSAYYETGALAAGGDWEKGATDAAANFKAAVSAGNIGQLFAGGVKKAGAEKYTRKVKDVGVPRFSQGVTAGIPDYSNGVGPMLDEIARITLPARQPRGSVANAQRVTAIMDALHKKRLALRAAGA
jgi:hypothetical protein